MEPPPPPAAAVRVESRPGLGNVLIALRNFAAGDTVVHEAPLLHVPQLKPSSPLYSPLNAYFERTHIPASVVLKILAFFTADPDAQAATLQCAAPEEAAFAAAPIVQQAKLFAATLLADPPLPDFVAQVDAYLHRQKQEQQEEDQQPCGQCITAVGPPPSAAPLRRPPPPTDAAGLLTRLWLVWVCNGHALRSGSALFEHGSKLTHTCGAANTAYRTAAGAPAPVHGLAPAEPAGTITTSSSAAARGAAASGSAAAPAGYHVAQGAVLAGDLLTTNYLGSGHRRLLSTPARQRLLADKFLFHCDCLRCTQEIDRARGIPCPSCSDSLRAPDKLLLQDLALPPLAVDPFAAPAASSSAAGDQQDSREDGTGVSSGLGCCGYLYYDPAVAAAAAAAGEAQQQPWTCDTCGLHLPDDTHELWGRHYTRSHATIEGDMEAWVLKLDESLDAAPLIREPAALHSRVLGVLRLLGPRHWASWRLLLIGVELHCGALEDAVVRAAVTTRRQSPAAAAAAAGAAPAGSPSPAAADTVAQLAGWVIRYSEQLWVQLEATYGSIEAGQLLGHHFTEAAAVLLQAAAAGAGGLLLTPLACERLVAAALQMQQRVLPGVRSLMGDGAFSPLKQVLGAAAAAAAAGGGGGNAAGDDEVQSVARYLAQRAADAARVQQAVEELRQLDPNVE